MEAFKSNSAQDALPLTPQPSRSESIAPSDNGEQHELDSNTDVMSSIASSTDNLSIVDRCPTIAPHKLNASFHNIFPIAIIPYDEECLFCKVFIIVIVIIELISILFSPHLRLEEGCSASGPTVHYREALLLPLQCSWPSC